MKKLHIQSFLCISLLINALSMQGMFTSTARQAQKAAAAKRAAQTTKVRPTISRQSANSQPTGIPGQSRTYGSSATMLAATPRSWFSYIPGSPTYNVEHLFNTMMLNMQLAGLVPSEQQINTFAKEASKIDYNIINREDADGHTLLSLMLAHMIGYLLGNQPKFEFNNALNIIDSLYAIGARLNDKDKNMLKQAPQLLINQINNYGRGITIKKVQLNDIMKWAKLFDSLYKLDVDLQDTILIGKMKKFIAAFENAEKYPYEPLGYVVIHFVGGNFAHMDDLGEYTIDGIEKKMIQNKKIPRMEHDIDVIMYELSRLGWASQNDQNIDFGAKYSIPKEQLRQAAHNGTLRVSLLRKFNLENRRDYGAPQYKKSNITNGAKDFIYDLLQQSHTIEVAKKLNEYADICANASFMRGLAGSETGSQGNKNNDNNYDNRSNYNDYSTNEAFPTILTLLGLPASTSKTEMEKTRRKYLMENHPDKLQAQVNAGVMTQKEALQRIEKVKTLNATYEGYKAEARQRAASE